MTTHVIKADNVCQALRQGVAYIVNNGHMEGSRAGSVLVAPGPVMTETRYPRQRVLFSGARDANPFFHLYEAVWMLGGRDDTKPLEQFVKGFGDNYGDSGVMHGAYGHRWRNAFGIDQLEVAVKKLREDNSTRQVVLQMWDCYSETQVGCNDLAGNWRDRPCNTHIYLRVAPSPDYNGFVLNMCVCCRSNDAIWGAHGANAVHFSVLQEYLAARVGVEMGTLFQLSWNYHVYLELVHKLAKKADATTIYELSELLYDDRYQPSYDGKWVVAVPAFTHPDFIDMDVKLALEWVDKGGPLRWVSDGNDSELLWPPFKNPWFRHTWAQAIGAHLVYRAAQESNAINLDTAIKIARGIKAPDWQVACVEWLQRRL